MTGKEITEKFFARHRSVVPTLTNKVLGLDFFLSSSTIADHFEEQAVFIKTLTKNPRLQKYFDCEFEYWVTKAKIDLEQSKKNYSWYQRIKEEKA
jgi:hypothetical protein